jgi:uncharacterized membrane protein
MGDNGNGLLTLEETTARRIARGLGVFSVVLGIAQVAAPRRFTRMIGVRRGDRAEALVRLVGVRELTAGAALLARSRPGGWLWARAAGDVMDLGLLAAALRDRGARRGRVGAAMAAVAGVTVPDVLGGSTLSGNGSAEEEPLHVKTAVTVNRPRGEVYGFWRDFENLPRFMAHLESVEVEDSGRSRWLATAPAGRTVEWEAEIVEESAGEFISWRALPGADVANDGTVRFVDAPGDRGTEVHLELRYDLPGGRMAGLLAKLFGEDPVQQVKDDLRRFKQVLETGEVVRSEGTPEGVHARRLLRQRPAQPTPSDDGS